MTLPAPLLDAIVPAPGHAVDWPLLTDALDWIRALDGVPQDPIFHAEGDVLTHTRLVVEALLADPAWGALGAGARRSLLWAALLHDVAKPATTRVAEDGRVTAPGHSRRGQMMARQILWRLGMPYAERERVCHLVTHHQLPFYLIERAAPERRAHLISHQTRCDWLAILARADANGRTCPDRQRLLDHIALFTELCGDAGCLATPRAFATDHSRFLYFRKDGRDPDYAAFDDWHGEAVLLSGLPAAGKDTWVAHHAGDAAVISLDALREALDIDPADGQGAVVAAARERARVALRAGRPLVWNATNLSRQIRGQIIDLMAAYRAKVRIVYVETGPDALERRNGGRLRPVPAAALERMLARWEPPDLTECHRLDLVVGS